MQKLDPYLNVDPGTMNPFQHGEVFVTNDGAETDLDVGHYERFLDVDLHGSANVTTGQVYSQVIAKERRGEYLGDTVQVIPHITNEIKARIRRMAGPEVDVVITEVGGTVGDIESLPFLEAIRQIRHEIGRDNVFFLHVSLLPYIGPSGELKTKPTQHSVAALRNIGIQPDAIVLRADREVPTSIKRKISLMCDVDVEAVVAAVDAPSIYDIPKVLHTEGLDAYVVRRLDLPFRDVDWTAWDQLLRRVHHPAHEVTVALVGKYVDLPDAYLSVTEALRAGGFANDCRVKIRWVTSDDCVTPEGAERLLGDVDAVCVPGGFGVRGIEGKLGALRFTRERGIPTLGPVPGPAVHGHRVRARRRRARGRRLRGVRRGHAAPGDRHDGRPARRRRGRARHGRHDAPRALPRASSPTARSCARSTARPYVDERHRHRYEVNNDYRGQLEAGGPVVLRHVAGRPARRVRRAAARRAPVLRRDAGPPRAALAADQGAPALPRPGRGRARAPGRARSTSRTPDVTAYVLDPTWPGDVRSLRDETDDRVVVARDERAPRARVGPAPRDRRPRRRPDRGARVRRAPGCRRACSRSTTPTGCCCSASTATRSGMSLWEPVAGLLDVADESPRVGAARELVEEAGLVADRWDVLVDVELLARRHERDHPAATSRATSHRRPGDARPATARSATCRSTWVPLEDAVAGVLAGRLTSPSTVIGVLAAYAARAAGWSTLRPVDAAWPAARAGGRHAAARGSTDRTGPRPRGDRLRAGCPHRGSARRRDWSGSTPSRVVRTGSASRSCAALRCRTPRRARGSRTHRRRSRR